MRFIALKPPPPPVYESVYIFIRAREPQKKPEVNCYVLRRVLLRPQAVGKLCPGRVRGGSQGTVSGGGSQLVNAANSQLGSGKVDAKGGGLPDGSPAVEGRRRLASGKRGNGGLRVPLN